MGELSKEYKVQKPRACAAKTKSQVGNAGLPKKGNITNTESIRAHPSRIILDRGIVQKRLGFGSQTVGGGGITKKGWRQKWGDEEN
jgi:hypothetical protein